MDTKDWLTLTKTNYRDHWKRFDAIRIKNRTLVVCGGRGVLRGIIEEWVDIANDENNICYKLEQGGGHDCIFYVESIDYKGKIGGGESIKWRILEQALL